MEFDPRIVKVSIEVKGRLKVYSDLAITCAGTKYANANQNDCEIQIVNLNQTTKDYLLTETSPFNRNKTPKRVIVEAGRKSYGTTKIYEGNISTAQPSQPPDVMVTLKCLTGDFAKSNVISRTQPGQASLSNIAQQVAKDLDVTLNFQAKDKQIGNYAFAGGALKQVDKLGTFGNVNAYVDDGVLVVKDYNVPIPGRIRILNAQSGMIGVPEITEQGVKVTYLLDNVSVLGGALRVESKINPAANGDYTIYKLGFNIATRDVPFYWIAEAKRA